MGQSHDLKRLSQFKDWQAKSRVGIREVANLCKTLHTVLLAFPIKWNATPKWAGWRQVA